MYYLFMCKILWRQCYDQWHNLLCMPSVPEMYAEFYETGKMYFQGLWVWSDVGMCIRCFVIVRKYSFLDSHFILYH